MDTLVTTQWLADHLDDPDLVLLDCTVVTMPEDNGGFHNVSGRPDYELGHIPNAGFADLLEDLSDTTGELEFILPTPQQFCAAMERLGVGDESKVVLYDTNYTGWAARVWWMLHWVGFDNAAILNGGMSAWAAEGRALSLDKVERPPGQLTPHPRPEVMADRDEVLAALDDASVLLIDTLPEAFYRGEVTMYHRPGHIPGAVSINGFRLFDHHGQFHDDTQLAAMHDFAKDRRIITYCGGGIVASSEAFVLNRLGFSHVAVYTASLQEWSADPSCPLVTGDQP